MIYSQTLNCVYVAIPKCGTTTIFDALKPLGFRQTPHNLTWPDCDWPQKGRHDRATLPGAKTITVVRHPVARLVSQFNDLMSSADKWELPHKYQNCSLDVFCRMLLDGDVNERPWLSMTQSEFLETATPYEFHRLEDISNLGGFEVRGRWVAINKKLNSREYRQQSIPSFMGGWLQQDIEAFGYSVES